MNTLRAASMSTSDPFDHHQSELLVRELFRRIDGRDWPSLSTLLHQEAIYERPGYEPLVGKDAIMHFYLNVRMIASGCHVVDCVLGNGRDIACWGSFSGKGRDGQPLEARFADVYRIRDGCIDLRRTYFDSPAI